MLKRLLCAVFLAVFCFGNVAYGMSNESVRKKLETTLRRELTGEILDIARHECKKAGLKKPREISIDVGSYDSKVCLVILKFSSYVPEKPVKMIAESLGVAVAATLKGHGCFPEGLLIVVQPCDLGTGANFYDAQTLSHENGELISETIPREEMMKLLNMQN